jgi:ATP-dependent RNA helicase DeaD
MPAPEDILSPSERQERNLEMGHRPGFDGANWFTLNAGRRHNADPRWLLPLICRYGHVGRADIGAIRIAANESYFQVSARATPGFVQALRRATIRPEDEGLLIGPAPPRMEATAQAPEQRDRAPRPKKKFRKEKVS